MSNGCKHGYLPPCTFCADERIRSEHAAMRAELSRMRTALEGALDRMDRARAILTDDNPRPECNWGMLDTSDIRAAIAERALAPEGRALTAGSGNE